MKNIIIQDDNGKDYEIKNIIKFKKHIKIFHTLFGEGDNSIHEENGRFFTVTKEFYRYIKHL